MSHDQKKTNPALCVKYAYDCKCAIGGKTLIKCKKLEIVTEDIKCKQLQDMQKEIDELRAALQETRDQVQVLLDLQRMRDIDCNKERYLTETKLMLTNDL